MPVQLRRPARYLDPGVPDGERALARGGITLVGTVKSGALVELVAPGASWEEWAARLTRYYSVVESLFSPDLFVVGGGVSKEHEEFLPLLDIRTPIVPAVLLNRAGVVGAALNAHRLGAS